MEDHIDDTESLSEERQSFVDDRKSMKEVVISDACGSFFGKQGGQIRRYEIPRDTYEQLMQLSESKGDPMWLADAIQEHSVDSEDISSDWIIPV